MLANSRIVASNCGSDEEAEDMAGDWNDTNKPSMLEIKGLDRCVHATSTHRPMQVHMLDTPPFTSIVRPGRT